MLQFWRIRARHEGKVIILISRTPHPSCPFPKS
jgi:hypothetical protein